MSKVSVICPGCQAKYRVTIQGEVKDKITFSCKKCSQIIEIKPPSKAEEKEPTTELVRTICKKCGAEFIKNVEDDSVYCYQCRIDEIVRRKKETAPPPEVEKTSSRYTFRNPDGLVLGPIKLRTVSVLVREKRIRGDEEVSKDGGPYKPIKDYPELVELFPELKMEVLSQPSEQKLVSEERIYFFRLSDGREFGPVKKSTIEDLLECGFFSGKDLVSADEKKWIYFEEAEEFKDFLKSEEVEIIDLTETIEE